ncbi:MAG: hypothetical protein JSV31_29285 [Desulfobacterales bacterium]|nr:MAG: hypothetical protein JSV31_29285 [Desulfobacterales bacterium]
MEYQQHHTSAFKTWLLIVFMVGIVLFKGWLAYTVIGDLGQPDWDYRPIMDVPGESPYAANDPYHPLPYAQHVLGEQGEEENPSHLKVIPFQGGE